MKPAPSSVTDEKGNPRLGTYTGTLESCSLAKLTGEKKFYRQKRWQYQIIITPDVVVLYAIVNLNYASSAFLTSLDLKTGEVVDKSFLGLLLLTKVSVSDESAKGLKAFFTGAGSELKVSSDGKSVSFGAQHPELSLNAVAQAEFSRALTVIAPVEGGIVNITQKLILSEVKGELQFKNKKFDLSQAVAGLDYTQGYLARRTCWRWAMGMGRLDDGTAFGFNLVEGINESPVTSENAFWVGDKVYPLGRASFQWNPENYMEEWRVQTTDGKIKLSFIPKFIHKEIKNLVLIKSAFVQPLGMFSGTVELEDRSFSFKDIGGVTEFQDSTW